MSIDPTIHVHGPFGTSALTLCKYGLAVIPVGGDDGKTPLVRWKTWKRPPSAGAIAAMCENFAWANVGIICHLSGITVVDIDDPDIVQTMIRRFGDTPLKIATPRGGIHLVYKHNGERCADLRRSEGLAVDVKGVGGFIVAPPSIRTSGQHAGKCYTILEGDWGLLGHLPKARTKNSSGIQAPTIRSGTGNQRDISVGQRNNDLFLHLLRQANHCDDFESLLDVAMTRNEQNYSVTLSDAEVKKTAASVWKIQEAGENWVGQEARAVITASEQMALSDNSDALNLLVLLRLKHGSRQSSFAVSPKSMASANVINGWRKQRFANALKWLIDSGFLAVNHRGGKYRGDASQYSFAMPTPRKGPQGRPNIIKHPPSLPPAPGKGDSWQENKPVTVWPPFNAAYVTAARRVVAMMFTEACLMPNPREAGRSRVAQAGVEE